MRSERVNRSLALATLALLASGSCGYHLGRPPIAAGGYTVAAVRAPVAEPDVADALKAALVDALVVRDALAVGDAQRSIEARIVELTEGPVAVDADGRLHRVALTLEITVAATGQRTILRGERAYPVPPDDPLEAASTRAAAIALLARDLAEDGIEWLVRAPAAGEAER